ncbi:glycosyltransferase [Methylocystis sp. SC2]|uniref:DUF7024 domain-containing protein n=1 Tax=Methylocystis sp. (strain SC2) TaxID=187303 RepID=UPI00027AE88D|nr:glycosyltransferase [Methylocystis sp. SC2]CCJ07931.1 Phosphoglycerol transferase I [Methylocystis sp. SC2]
MKIALLNAFPNLAHSAEREFINRSIAAFERLGHEAVAVVTSGEIIDFDPSFVIVTHEFVPKLTSHYTVGLLWSPTQFYKSDPDRVKAIRSWDLVAPVNAETRRFARDVHFPLRRESVSDLDFYPSSPVTDLSFPDHSKLSLAYVGTWDGERQNQLFRALAEVVDLHVYGPPKAWEFLSKNYRGSIPFDGEAVIYTFNQHGAALAIHKSSHVEDNTPSMRVFEACAAKCLVITDPLKPLENLFGDSLEYVDTWRSPKAVATYIAELMEGYRKHPERYVGMIARADEVFRSKASLERLLTALVEDVSRHIAERVRAAGSVKGPAVTVILRCGSRPLPLVQRAIASLTSQTYKRVGVIFARYAEIEGFENWLTDLSKSGKLLFTVDLACPGGGVRSRAMWAGFREVRTELFCMLDDDDEWLPNHLSDLVALLRDNPEVPFVYTGVIRQEEDGGFLNDHARFAGEMGADIPERRVLQCFDDFNLDRLLRFDNYIQSNTWLARTEVLTPAVLEDPELEVAEDLYFYLLLASRHRFLFSGTVSAIWNWRSKSADNSSIAISQDQWAINGEHMHRRLSQLTFPGNFQGSDVLSRGRVDHQQYRAREDPGSSVQDAVLELGTEEGSLYNINFSLSKLPAYLAEAKGLSHRETWGRWTIGHEMLLRFRDPLPKCFTLKIYGRAFESNHQRPITVVVGGSEATLVMCAEINDEIYTVKIHNDDAADFILFRIPNPKSPAELRRSNDRRRLGIGLAQLEIVEDRDSAETDSRHRRTQALDTPVASARFVFSKLISLNAWKK